MAKKYIVRLTVDERATLLDVVGKLKRTSEKVRRAMAPGDRSPTTHEG